jgi:hypothetical protein
MPKEAGIDYGMQVFAARLYKRFRGRRGTALHALHRTNLHIGLLFFLSFGSPLFPGRSEWVAAEGKVTLCKLDCTATRKLNRTSLQLGLNYNSHRTAFENCS